MGQKTKKLTSLDLSYLIFESSDCPQHVAAMMIYKKPKGAGPEYLRELVADLRAPKTLRDPFNKQLVSESLSEKMQPYWTYLENVDLDYHVRHISLPQPGSDEDLMRVVSLIHSSRLARSRPMWEFYIIEGYKKDMFVGYFKIHHSVIDGIGAMRMMNATLSKDSDDKFVPPWALRSRTSKQKPQPSVYEMIRTAYGEALSQVKTVPGLTKSLTQMAQRALSPNERSTLPYAAPNTRLNRKIQHTRGLGMRSFELSKVKRIGKTLGCSVNDIVLAMCSGALRNYLLSHHDLPNKSLIALIPVSIRTSDASGNQFASLLCDLATNERTPEDRLMGAKNSMAFNKHALERMGKKGVANYSNLLSAPFAVTQALGISQKIRPAFNLVISNVAGPKETMYLKGSELLGLYAGTLLFEGQAVSILITSYADSLDFCVTVCKETVPDYEKLTDFLGEELCELEKLAEEKSS